MRIPRERFVRGWSEAEGKVKWPDAIPEPDRERTHPDNIEDEESGPYSHVSGIGDRLEVSE